MKIDRLKGTRDFGSEKMRERRDLELRMRRIFESFGYDEIQTPTIEPLELFLLKSGEAVLNETYNFKDKGGRDVCLVPERTAPTIRFYVNEMQKAEKPLKLYYFENCFRYENPQKARYREFWQFGAELIGIRNRAKANAELICLAVRAIREAGIEARVRIGDLNLLRPAVEKASGKMDTRELMRAIDKWDKERIEALGDERLMSLLSCKSVEGLEDSEEEKELLRGLFGYLDAYGVEAELDMSIARGLDYYHGIVFEIDCPALGAEKQVAGGGEYSLIELFGGEETGSSGFAIGFDRIVEAGKRNAETERKGAFFLPLSEESYTFMLPIMEKMRTKNLRCEIENNNRRTDKAMSYADAKRYRYVILRGNREAERGKMTIKDLETGEQMETDADRLEIILSAEK
jgi:histidyl-tRNA synthetase